MLPHYGIACLALLGLLNSFRLFVENLGELQDLLHRCVFKLLLLLASPLEGGGVVEAARDFGFDVLNLFELFSRELGEARLVELRQTFPNGFVAHLDRLANSGGR